MDLSFLEDFIQRQDIEGQPTQAHVEALKEHWPVAVLALSLELAFLEQSLLGLVLDTLDASLNLVMNQLVLVEWVLQLEDMLDLLRGVFDGVYDILLSRLELLPLELILVDDVLAEVVAVLAKNLQVGALGFVLLVGVHVYDGLLAGCVVRLVDLGFFFIQLEIVALGLELSEHTGDQLLHPQGREVVFHEVGQRNCFNLVDEGALFRVFSFVRVVADHASGVLHGHWDDVLLVRAILFVLVGVSNIREVIHQPRVGHQEAGPFVYGLPRLAHSALRFLRLLVILP
mmetsp:Transcript_35681/g.54596  ORF Transcript_35681/g.54596 Transcript_35681/m.54596 type:complete len:286 (+) Transcript_35681:1222-2079(+)